MGVVYANAKQGHGMKFPCFIKKQPITSVGGNIDQHVLHENLSGGNPTACGGEEPLTSFRCKI
jgi:hypothetical protein